MALIDLRKKAGIVLEKRGLRNVRARVGLAVDASGSMRGLYDDGTVQRTVERLLALSLRLDDDGSMDLWAFSEDVLPLPAVTEAGFEGYIGREIVDQPVGPLWGGTTYAPPVRAALRAWFPASTLLSRLFGGAPAMPVKPSLLVFVTDGENTDGSEAERAMAEAASRPVYFAFVGVGAAAFAFCRTVADRYPNVGFSAVPDLAGLDEDALYERVVTEELATWLKGTPPA